MIKNEYKFSLMTCKNCGQPAPDNFCAHCGQNTKVRPINFANFMADISEGVFQLNRGFLHTMIGLFNRPGALIQAYLAGRRKPYFKPIAYAFTLSTLYFLVSRGLDRDTFMNYFIEGFTAGVTGGEEDRKAIHIMVWFANNYAYTTLLLLPVHALASFLAFRKLGYNWLEHTVLNAYIIGQQAIFFLLASIAITLFGAEDIISSIIFLMSVGYVFLVYWQFFHEISRSGRILRTLLSYVLYLVFFILLIALVLGTTLD